MVMEINKNSSTLMKLFQKRVFSLFTNLGLAQQQRLMHIYTHHLSTHSRFIFRIIFVLQMSKNVIICMSCCWMGHLRECSHTLTHFTFINLSRICFYDWHLNVFDMRMNWPKFLFWYSFYRFRNFSSRIFPIFLFLNWLLCLKINKNEIFLSGFIRLFFQYVQ